MSPKLGKLNGMVSRTAILPALILCGVALVAQRIPEHAAGMKGAGGAMRVLSKLESKTGADAVRSAERLGGLYEELINFWRQRDDKQAVKWAQQGKAAAVQLAAAAHAGDAAQASVVFKSIEATCASCHEAHRTRLADGTYAFKPEPDPTAPRQQKK